MVKTFGPPIVSVVVVGIVYVLLGLPDQSMHGEPQTLIPLISSVVIPPVLLAVGVYFSFKHKGRFWKVAACLNIVGLIIYALWISGILGKWF